MYQIISWERQLPIIGIILAPQKKQKKQTIVKTKINITIQKSIIREFFYTNFKNYKWLNKKNKKLVFNWLNFFIF